MGGLVDIDVTNWTPELLEARGSGANEWLRDTAGALWLFKATRRVRATGDLQGEDWAEKVVEGLAHAIGVPCARVEVAHRSVAGHRQPGVISLDLAGPGTSFLNGHNLLAELPGYKYRDDEGVKPPKNHSGHSVETVREQLAAFEVGAPVDSVPTWMTAFDVFAGFLALDAWVGNADRHEDNWAVLREPGGLLRLAPSYDHGAALGSTLTEFKRTELSMNPVMLDRFAERGFGKKFDGGHTTPLVTFAVSALSLAGRRTLDHWTSRIADVGEDQMIDIMAGVPRMSDASRTFCTSLLMTNRRRLLDACR